jgi:hypothetical protein
MRYWLAFLLALSAPVFAAQTTFPVINGVGGTQQLNAESNGTSFTPHSAPEVNGAAVSTANPLPSVTPPTTYTTPLGPISVGTSSGAVLAAGLALHRLDLQTNPSCVGNVWLNTAGGTAVVGQGITLAAYGGGYSWPNGVTLAINGISDNGPCNVSGSAG